MDIHVGWLELAIICGAWMVVSIVNVRAQVEAQQQQGGLDTVPGNVLGQAPEAEMEEGRLGFRH
jgi:hypothetical protein